MNPEHGLRPDIEQQPIPASAPEKEIVPPVLEKPEIFDKDGLLRDAESVRQLEEAQEVRAAELAAAEQLRKQIQTSKEPALAPVPAPREKTPGEVMKAMESELSAMQKDIDEQFGIDAQKPGLGGGIKWLFSGEARHLLKDYRELSEKIKETRKNAAQRTARTTEAALKSGTEEDKNSRAQVPPEARW